MNTTYLKQYPLFDSHFHIIDPRFPLVPNNGYLPDAFTAQDYLDKLAHYTLCGGAIVSGSFQAFDQGYLIDALNTLGDNFVGVTQIPAATSDQEILDLHQAGIRAVRFNLKRGGSESVENMVSMANRVYELAGWHIELYIDSVLLPELYDDLVTLPAVSIDHLGLSQAGFQPLLKLAEKGVRVKATGFSRVDFNVSDALKALYAANPECLMFGTDVPSTRAPKPYSDDDFLLVLETLGEQACETVMSKNALAFYQR